MVGDPLACYSSVQRADRYARSPHGPAKGTQLSAWQCKPADSFCFPLEELQSSQTQLNFCQHMTKVDKGVGKKVKSEKIDLLALNRISSRLNLSMQAKVRSVTKR